MANSIQLSSKRLLIDKANSTMVGVIAGCVFVVMFSLVASKTLLSQRSYQARVIAKKEQARDTLKANVESVKQLVNSYQGFVSAPDNFLGGNPTGTGDKDGDNAKLVLDALPSKYDFPALITSIEKLLTDKNFKIDSITGTDDLITQQGQQASSNPQPVDMPFEFTVTGTYGSTQDLISSFEKSIRPFQLEKLSYTGTDAKLDLHMTAKTYYQPEKSLNIRTEEVK